MKFNVGFFAKVLYPVVIDLFAKVGKYGVVDGDDFLWFNSGDIVKNFLDFAPRGRKRDEKYFGRW